MFIELGLTDLNALNKLLHLSETGNKPNICDKLRHPGTSWLFSLLEDKSLDVQLPAVSYWQFSCVVFGELFFPLDMQI